jgi:hypothetical protein
MELETRNLNRLLEGLIRELIQPLMRALEKEVNHPIKADVIAGLFGQEVTGIASVAASLPGTPAKAEVRAIFRESRFQNDVRFRVESVIYGMPNGYSGFQTGWEYLSDNGEKLALKAEREIIITHRYETWRWVDDWPFVKS